MKNVIVLLILILAFPIFGQRTSPEEIQNYTEKATSATLIVISSADDLKEFKSSTKFQDIWTSAGALQEYEDFVTSYSYMLKTVQDNLLSTATQLLEISQYEIQAAKQGLKYRGSTY